MKVRKAIKKIVALGLGVSMLGATLLGATAADFKDYPKPMFIGENGAFNGVIIVGDTAKTEDVVGATNVLASIQAAAVKETTVSVGSGTTTTFSGENVKMETDSDEFVIGEDIFSVKTALGSTDLPTLLADGVYVNDGDDASTNHDYTQKLEFFDGYGNLTFYEDRDYTIEDDTPHVMVYAPKKHNFTRYTLDFTKDVESDVDTSSNDCGDANELCDMEDTKLTMLGKQYDITKAENGSTIIFELMGAATIQTLYEGETATYTLNGKDYEVTVDIISDSSTTTSVIMSVNGDTTKQLTKGQTDNVAGIEMGVKELLGNEAGEEMGGKDMVSFYLGASKIRIVDADPDTTINVDDEIQLGSEDVDGMYGDIVTYYGTSGKQKVSKIVLTWQPDDDVFVTEDQSVTFPGLESFKFEFLGLKKGNEEQIVIEPHGNNKVQLRMPLETGEQSFDVLYDAAGDGTFDGLGSSATEKLYVTNAQNISEGNYLVVTDLTQEETHIVEFDKINSDGVVTLKGLNGVKYEGSCSSPPCTVNIGDNTVTIAATSIGNSVITVSAGLNNVLFTKEGLAINLTGSAAVYNNITLTEEDTNGNVLQGDQLVVNVTMTTDHKTTVSNIIDKSGTPLEKYAGDSDGFYTLGDTDDYAAMTNFGTYLVWHKGGDQDYVELTYPGQEAHGQLYVTSIGTTATTTDSAGTVTTTEIVPLPLTASKLASEVTDVTTVNAIVVGGPCVNTAAAKLMGNPTNCVEGFETGKAKIKLYENGDKVGLLVAGRTALDTRRATSVLAEYGKYADDMVGTEVEVTGTSLTDISVGKPAPAVVEEPVVEPEAEGE